MSLCVQPASVNRLSAPTPTQLPLFPDDAPIQTDFRKVPNAFARHFRDAGLSYGQACMVNAIRSHARKNHLPAPSLARVALELHTDVRQVQRWLKEMQRDSLVVIHERQGLHGQLANAYDFTPLFRRCAEIAAALKESRPAEATNAGEVSEEQYPIAWEAPAPVEIAARPVQESTTPPVVKNTTPLETGTYVPRERRQNDPPTPTERPSDQTRPQARLSLEEQAIAGSLARIGPALGDQAAPLASVRQADDMRVAAELGTPVFLSLLHEAFLHTHAAIEARDRRRTLAPIEKPMGYFFAVLAQLISAPEAAPPRRRRDRPTPTMPLPPSPSAPPSDLWETVTAEVGQIMTAENIAQWFRTAHQLDHAGDVLTVAVPDAFHHRWLDVRYRAKIEQCAQRVQPGLQLAFVVQPCPLQSAPIDGDR